MRTRRTINGAHALVLAAAVAAASVAAAGVPTLNDHLNAARAARGAATHLREQVQAAQAAAADPKARAAQRQLATAIPDNATAETALADVQRAVTGSGATVVSSTASPAQPRPVAGGAVVAHTVTVGLTGSPAQVATVVRSLGHSPHLVAIDAVVLSKSGPADALLTVTIYSLHGQD